jgi:methyl-accepting chemotaxis protein
MKWFTNLKVAHKLAIGFGCCMFFALVGGVVALNQMSVMDSNTKSIANDALAGSTSSQIIQRLGMEAYISELNIAPGNPPSVRNLFMNVIPDMKQKEDAEIQNYEQRAHEPEDLSNLKAYKANWEVLSNYMLQAREAALANDSAKYRSIIAAQFPSLAISRACVFKLVDWNLQQSPQFVQKAHSAYTDGRAFLIILLLAAFVIALALSTFITRIITGSLTIFCERLTTLEVSLGGLAGNAEALSDGNFVFKDFPHTNFLHWNRKDEFGKLANAFDGMLTQAKAAVAGVAKAQKSLSQLIGTTRVSAETIALASEQLATGNDDLSSRTSEQASSLEETVATMEQMTSVVKHNADNAREASILSAEARSVAQNGGEIVRQAVTSMNEINEASKRINDIVSVIDEIAFQTNLLALNAAVEAARVGAQGRGFAVVASEVRNLAGRSSVAAKEIKSLVQDSVSKVNNGTALVNKSGQKLTEIVSSVEKVAEIISGISTASQEQSAGIGQVNQSVIQLEHITQQNAALVEEATASSQNMSEQAADLLELVHRFKLDEEYLASQQTNTEPQLSLLRPDPNVKTTGNRARSQRRAA